MKGEELLSTPTAFRAYLLTLAPETPVGDRAIGSICPLAVFLEHHGADEANVDDEEIEVSWKYAPEEYLETPAWAAQFIAEVDGAKDYMSDVTAAEALTILNRIAPEVMP